MNIREFREAVEFNIEHKLRHSILGLGAPGVGKSQIIRQIGKKYGNKVIDIRLAQMSEVEIGGLIYPNESRTKTVWLAPDILPNEERDGKNTILLLDEITSCTKRVQVAAYQLILDRRIGQYQLPEGTFVIALGNREDDDGVYIRLADPLADRFEIHYIDSDFEVWKEDFALKYGVHPYVVDYLTYNPSSLHTQSHDVDAMVFATPRSWERVSDILKLDSDFKKPVVRNKIRGNVGDVEAAQFLAFLEQMVEVDDMEDILSGRVTYPSDPRQLSLLVSRVVDWAQIPEDAAEGADSKRRARIERAILGLIRFPQAEYAILGLKRMLDINKPLIKEIFDSVDDKEMQAFVKKHYSAIGIAPKGGLNNTARSSWLSMWKDS